MKQYLDALRFIMDTGEARSDRTGIGTQGVFGYQMRFDLTESFPAVTTKNLAWRAVVGELLWFLEGSADERRLAEITFEKPRAELTDKKTIWTANADAQGVALGYPNSDEEKYLGPVYGVQWRAYNSKADSWGMDQIEDIIYTLKTNPDSRRIILNAWNPNQTGEMALPPCHLLAQFYVSHGKLSCQMYQRSVDAALGLPFNIASYSLLTHMLAQIVGLEVGEFIHTSGDMHIYLNHIGAVNEQLTREPKPGPQLIMPAFTNLEELLATKPSDYILEGYDPHPTIKMDMAV